jgi:hypothetical protein
MGAVPHTPVQAEPYAYDMEPWKIEKAWDCAPVPGSDRAYARAFILTRGTQRTETTVEFAAGGRPGSARVALKALRPCLSDKSLPRRLIVNRDEAVRESGD